MKYGLPANAENAWYGLSPKLVGPTGSTCQYDCPAATRSSTKSYALFPKVPIPYGDGSELTGRRIPAPLLSSCCLMVVITSCNILTQ